MAAKDEDKKHGHQLAGPDRVLQFGREAGKRRYHETEVDVPRGEETGRDEYIDHAGRRTVVRYQSSGRVDVFVGDDVKFRVADTKRELIATARGIDPTDRSSRDAWKQVKESWKAAGRCPEDDALWQQLRTVEDQYHQRRAAVAAAAVDGKERLIAEARRISADDRSGRDLWQALMGRWQAAGRASKADDDRLWSELQRVRDGYQREVDHMRRERNAEGERALVVKRDLVARARRIDVEDRAARDEWKRINDEWKRAGRGPRVKEDELWAELQSVRTSYQRQVDDLRQRRETEGQRAVAAKRSLISRARGISIDDRSGREQWQRINDEWKRAGRGPKDEEDRLWADLQAVRTTYQDKLASQRRQRETDGKRAIEAKRGLLARARAISAEDRGAADAWRSLNDEWKQAGRGPKDEEDRLWTELSAIRDAYNRARMQAQERRRFELRQRAGEVRSRAYQLEQRASDVQGQIYRAQAAPTYQGKDMFKLAESMRRRSEKIASLERKQRDLYTKAQELKTKANDLELKAGR